MLNPHSTGGDYAAIRNFGQIDTDRSRNGKSAVQAQFKRPGRSAIATSRRLFGPVQKLRGLEALYMYPYSTQATNRHELIFFSFGGIREVFFKIFLQS